VLLVVWAVLAVMVGRAVFRVRLVRVVMVVLGVPVVPGRPVLTMGR
jgi:hypothetical protein